MSSEGRVRRSGDSWGRGTRSRRLVFQGARSLERWTCVEDLVVLAPWHMVAMMFVDTHC